MEIEDEIKTFTIPPEGIDRIDTWLTTQCEGFSRARIQGLMKAKRVALNGSAVLRGTTTTHPGDVITVAIPPPVPADPEPENIPLDILFEDDDILVLDKPAGLVVHPAPGHLTGTLVNALLHHCPHLGGIGGVARPGIVHRLDQDTSGVMIVAKSQRAMDVLTREFASHANLRKTYLALVHGIPSPLEGHIENLIGRCPFDRKKMAVVTKNGKLAVTEYKTTKTIGGVRGRQSPTQTECTIGGVRGRQSPRPSLSPAPLALVECTILTGRTHQIRVHMASTLSCPILGDPLYGRLGWDKQLPTLPTRQLLHAWRLALKHPVTREPMAFEAPLPEDFRPFLDEWPAFAKATEGKPCP